MKKRKVRKPFVYRSTIWNSVGGGLNYSGQSKLCKVGKHKVLLTRGKYLNKYGNPVHTATYIHKGGVPGKTTRGTGSATLVVSRLLRKQGVDVKYKK